MKKRNWTKEEIGEYRTIHGVFFYFNKEDANFLVPKPYGIGWTVNWANPITWFCVSVIAGFYLMRFFLKRVK
ncbi:DUF5808 domain-containing protein [Acetobacterium sp.]|uniref:DUF5808 domain-containing protein n=1 Tax=Acetobacterium sp. TaxID=1872094 RepID=UPI002F3F106F